MESKKKLEDLKRLKALFRKYDGALKAKYDLAPFNEPILMLERVSGKIEFYDKAIAGVYTFEHSDGTRRHITLKGFPKTMQFYGQNFKVWTCHEDFPFQTPPSPIVDSELFTMSKDKDLNDTVNYKARELTAKGKMIKEIVIAVIIAVAVVVGLLILTNILAPDLFSKSAPVVKEVSVNTSKFINATIV